MAPSTGTPSGLSMVTAARVPSATVTVTGCPGENPTAPSTADAVSFGLMSSVTGLESIGASPSVTLAAPETVHPAIDNANTSDAATIVAVFETDPTDCARMRPPRPTPMDNPTSRPRSEFTFKPARPSPSQDESARRDRVVSNDASHWRPVPD